MSETISTAITENYYYHDAASKPVKPEYHVVMAYSLTSLEQTVNGLLANGWLPQGGVSVGVNSASTADRNLFAQAMVKGVGR